MILGVVVLSEAGSAWIRARFSPNVGLQDLTLLLDRVTHVPIYELAFIWGVGPRAEEPGVNLIRSFAYSGPLEDIRVKRP